MVELRDLIKSDYLYFDGTEAIVYTYVKRVNGTETTTQVEVRHALRRALSARELAASNGAYQSLDIVWHLPVAELEGTDVRPGEGRIKPAAGGPTYAILDASLNTLRTRWKCVSRDPVISGRLYDTASFYHPVEVASAAGNRSVTFPTAYQSAVACRLQPEGGDVDEAMAVKGVRRRWTLYCEPFAGIKAGDRATVGGVHYTAVSHGSPEDMNTLLEVSLERLP
jgi:hypothetical protein